MNLQAWTDDFLRSSVSFHPKEHGGENFTRARNSASRALAIVAIASAVLLVTATPTKAFIALYHDSCTQAALNHRTSAHAEQSIINYNEAVDTGPYTGGDHFDRIPGQSTADAFYIAAANLCAKRNIAIEYLLSGNRKEDTFRQIGRALHTLQDFYSHSNYVYLTDTEQNDLRTAIWTGNPLNPPAALLHLRLTGFDYHGSDYWQMFYPPGDDYPHGGPRGGFPLPECYHKDLPLCGDSETPITRDNLTLSAHTWAKLYATRYSLEFIDQLFDSIDPAIWNQTFNDYVFTPVVFPDTPVVHFPGTELHEPIFPVYRYNWGRGGIFGPLTPLGGILDDHVGAAVFVPANAVQADCYLYMVQVNCNTIPGGGSPPFLVPIRMMELMLQGADLAAPVIIGMKYDPAEMGPIRETDLGVYEFNLYDNATWSPMPLLQVDTVDRTVFFETDHRGVFCIGGEPAGRHVPVDPAHARLLEGGKAAGDTTYVMGGRGRSDGKFQTSSGLPDRQGWTGVASPASTGDFSQVWPHLADADPRASNGTPQFAFIDDGMVVPGTGGTSGVSWTYGPGGYVVNQSGGLAGPCSRLHDEIWSPPLALPAGTAGAVLAFDVYRHLPLSNGLFYVWRVRDSVDGGVSWSGWQDRNSVYYGDDPAYLRVSEPLTGLLDPGSTHVQIALGVVQNDRLWGYGGTDGTPSPYFDNVAVTAFGMAGPSLAVQDISVFQDNFPASGVLDYSDLSRNFVRLDIAENISLVSDARNDPGDSMVVRVKAVRAGATELVAAPRMFIKMKANPLFSPFRILPSGFTSTGGIITGYVDGDSVRNTPTSRIVRDSWSFDLPDTGFCFPGDLLHYYVEAADNVLGDIGTSRVPNDTTGFSLFTGQGGSVSLRYPSAFTVRALPTMHSAVPGDQPHILFWNDASGGGGEEEWLGALANLGYREGIDYDVYKTNGPSSGVGNGLGGRATVQQLAGYSTLMYTAGDLGSFTMSNGDMSKDPGNDIGVVDAFLRLGGKNMFATGNNFESDLNRSGVAGVAFRNTWLSVNHNGPNVRPLIGGQSTPLVAQSPGNGIISRNFVANCDGGPIRNFNAVTVTGTASRLAAFTTASGTGVYPYAAVVSNVVAAFTARIVWSPIDFMFWSDPGSHAAPVRPVRASLLQEILVYFGHSSSGPVTDVPSPELSFGAKNYPNPFNPSTRIEYSMPRAGQLTIRIYNVRGELVRTVLNEQVTAGTSSVVWRGDDDRGRAVSSGVYFYEVKGDGQKVLRKVALVK